jgi:hypothetical protein
MVERFLVLFEIVNFYAAQLISMNTDFSRQNDMMSIVEMPSGHAIIYEALFYMPLTKHFQSILLLHYEVRGNLHGCYSAYAQLQNTRASASSTDALYHFHHTYSAQTNAAAS